MATNTRIEWADATINPLVGCSKVSPACAHCYAERLAARFGKNPSTARLYEGTVDEAGNWTGKLNLFPERMEEALRWKKPRRIFVASQSDLFHEDVPDSFLDTIFSTFIRAPQHTFLLLTKRAKRMHEYLHGLSAMDCAERRERLARATKNANWSESGGVVEVAAFRTVMGNLEWPLPNVHIGVTVEDQKRADERIPWLLRTPAALRFVSCEPLLGYVDFSRVTMEDHIGCDSQVWPLHGGIQHVIIGGESGPDARPTHPNWIRSLVKQCEDAGVPKMLKQLGEWCPRSRHPIQNGLSAYELDFACKRWPCVRLTESGKDASLLANSDGGEDIYMQRVGRALAGRMLDGKEYLELPEANPGQAVPNGAPTE